MFSISVWRWCKQNHIPQPFLFLFLLLPNPSCLYQSSLNISFIRTHSFIRSLLPSSAAQLCTEGMAAVVSIIHFPSEQVVFALQGAAGENGEGEEARLKTRKHEE